MTAAVHARREAPRGSGLLYLLAALAVLAPLYKGGNRPLPLMTLELCALGLLVALVVARKEPFGLSKSLTAAIALLFVYPLVQLVPLPASLWASLPGHEPYASIVARFGDAHDGIWRALSLEPAKTEAAWLALLPPLACLLGVMRLSSDNATRLLLVMAVFAGAEGVLGLMQVGTGDMFSFAERQSRIANTSTGTFVNKNHLAAMLGMILPVMLALIVRRLRHDRRHRRISGHAAENFAQTALLFGSTTLVLVCLLMTRSRTGIATAILALAAMALVLVSSPRPHGHAHAEADDEGRAPRRRVLYAMGAFVVVTLALALAIGVSPLLAALEPGTVSLDARGRIAIYATTLQAALEFLPFGSGLGTFADVYPRFQPFDAVAGFGGFVNHAHNDYLESFLELGVVGPIVVLVLLWSYGARMFELLRGWNTGRSFPLLQLGAGVGMLPVILHSALDFPLHMPAIAMWFALLAGILFHAPATAEETHRRGARSRTPHAPHRAGQRVTDVAHRSSRNADEDLAYAQARAEDPSKGTLAKG